MSSRLGICRCEAIGKGCVIAGHIDGQAEAASRRLKALNEDLGFISIEAAVDDECHRARAMIAALGAALAGLEDCCVTGIWFGRPGGPTLDINELIHEATPRQWLRRSHIWNSTRVQRGIRPIQVSDLHHGQGPSICFCAQPLRG